jgi:hypothetical protein
MKSDLKLRAWFLVLFIAKGAKEMRRIVTACFIISFVSLYPSYSCASILECTYIKSIGHGEEHTFNWVVTINTESDGWKTNDSEYWFEGGKVRIHIARGSGGIVRVDEGFGNMFGTCVPFTKSNM